MDRECSAARGMWSAGLVAAALLSVGVSEGAGQASPGATSPSGAPLQVESVPATAPPIALPPWLIARLDRAVDDGVAEGITPGASLVIGFGGQVALIRNWGRLDWDPGAPAINDSSIYDLASLTKAMATTSVAMRLVEDGRLDLDAPVSTYLDAWPSAGVRGDITARHLLTHTSGLPAAAQLWRENHGRDEYVDAIAAMALQGNPGQVQIYSDLGMIVLGVALERIAGAPLDVLTREWVTGPLNMAETTFLPSAAELSRSRIVPTERNGRTGELVQGTVHDANAHAMGGVAGHAGLFGSPRDLGVFAGAVLWGTPGAIACASTVEEFASRPDPESRFSLGWEKPVPEVIWSDFFTDDAYGHTGFTGTSLWIDPQHDLFVVFLTSRLNSTRDDDAIHDLRRWVHRAVHGWIVDPMSAPAIARAGDDATHHGVVANCGSVASSP